VPNRLFTLLYFNGNIKISLSKLSGKVLTAKLGNEEKMNVETSSFISPKTKTFLSSKSTIFCDITPRSPLSANRRFGETYHLHLQGRENNKLSKKPE
jgi:hypothetical protein